MSWEFTLDRLEEIRSNPREAMIGRQEAEKLVDRYISDYRRGITCAHCSGDMSKQKTHGRCSNDGLCISIEEFEQRKERDKQQLLLDQNIRSKAIIDAAKEIIGIAYAHGRGGIIEFRPHEFDDLKAALEAIVDDGQRQ